MSIYDLTVLDAEGKPVSLSNYKGKVLLIVNTATECGFTPQYTALQALQEKYEAQGFEVLDFPCNQFGGQAPGSTGEIANFCQGKFGVTFQTFDKIEVNGKNAAPLYQFLKEEAKAMDTPEEGGLNKAFNQLKDKVIGNGIKWNFTKFLVDRHGRVIGRFAPTYKPEQLEPLIEKLLSA